MKSGGAASQRRASIKPEQSSVSSTYRTRAAENSGRSSQVSTVPNSASLSLKRSAAAGSSKTHRGSALTSRTPLSLGIAPATTPVVGGTAAQASAISGKGPASLPALWERSESGDGLYFSRCGRDHSEKVESKCSLGSKQL